MFTALLDTCVLWPSLQRDFLLSLAAEGMYRPVWSDVVLAELEYEEAQKLIRRGEGEGQANERARHLIEQIRRAFDDAEVHGWEGLEGTYGLPDPDDEHLVAAAVVAGAGAIVTHNVADLPQEVRPTRLKAPKARRPASKAPVPKLVGSGNPSGWLPPGPSGCAHGSVSKDSATKLDHGEVAQFRAAGQWRLAEASRSPIRCRSPRTVRSTGARICAHKWILDACCPCQGPSRGAVRRTCVLVRRRSRISEKGRCPDGGSRRES